MYWQTIIPHPKGECKNRAKICGRFVKKAGGGGRVVGEYFEKKSRLMPAPEITAGTVYIRQ